MRKKINIFFASVIFAVILWGSISLSDYYYTNIDVKLTLTNFPEGYTTGSELPEKIKLRVRGQGWKLVSLNVGPESEFRISVAGDSGRQHLSLLNYLESNRWLISDVDIINLFPDSIKFNVERIITKKLPVVPELDLEFKPGYGLASDIKIKPDSVLVKGPFSYLKTMKEIKTSEMRISQLDSKTSTALNFPGRFGFEYSSNVVNVNLDVQRIVDRQFDGIFVDVTDVPAGKDVVLLPNKININVRGGIEILGKLNSDEFKAYVKYQTLFRDTTGSVAPELILPKNVTLQFSKPDRLRYVIRSF